MLGCLGRACEKARDAQVRRYAKEGLPPRKAGARKARTHDYVRKEVLAKRKYGETGAMRQLRGETQGEKRKTHLRMKKNVENEGGFFREEGRANRFLQDRARGVRGGCQNLLEKVAGDGVAQIHGENEKRRRARKERSANQLLVKSELGLGKKEPQVAPRTDTGKEARIHTCVQGERGEDLKRKTCM